MNKFKCNGCGKIFTEEEVKGQIDSDTVCCDSDGFGMTRVSIKSIDRLAMDIAGKSEVIARETLDRFGFSLAEQSEIIASHMRLPKHSSGWMDSDWQAVAVTIRSTMECSIRLGDRLDFGI